MFNSNFSIRFISLALTTALIALPILASPDIGACRPFDGAEFKDLVSQIQILNLVNDLNLDRGQMERLMAIASENAKMESGFRELIEADKSEILRRLERFRDELFKGPTNLDPKVLAEFEMYKRKIENVKDTHKERMDELAKTALDVLDENQKILVNTYKPCLVPKVNSRSPERAGQAGAHKKFDGLMDRIRKMDSKTYGERKSMLAGRFMDKARKRKFVIEDEKAEESRVLAIVDSLRKLDEASYNLKKDELVEQLIEPYGHGDPKAELRASGRNIHREDLGHVKNFLIDPNIVPILKRKLEQK